MVGIDPRSDHPSSLIAEVQANAGNKIVPVAADLTNPANVDAVMTATDGKIDVLANVAGIMDSILGLAEVDDETQCRSRSRLEMAFTISRMSCFGDLPCPLGFGSSGSIIAPFSSIGRRLRISVDCGYASAGWLELDWHFQN
ncbi:hypothetical protein [Consotaella salsifontis]|uniref:hypothetical protein n=1 Tax=Consotaella salsifontis TaxID=1365950 RepID=UPI000999136A|nr:hypothetical protein [Consotaella salsifontis]